MSDIRFNNWKHQSGTGGVSQNSGGNVGIGSTLPSSKLDVGGDGKFTGVVTATTFIGALTGNVTGNVNGVVTPSGDLNVGSNIKLGTASGIITATSYRGDASQMTGAGLGTDGSANTSGIITATAFVPTTGQLSHRNLVHNGSFQVAQRGASSTTANYATVDRFLNGRASLNEAPTQAQHALTSGDTGPYAEGFRFSYHITNGNQTIGADADAACTIRHSIEAQNIAQSGWNYTSTSSFITLQFWVKSSVAQNFHFAVKSVDGTVQDYVMETGSLTADTWTKITKTIPGNSNLQFDTDSASNCADRGFDIVWQMYRGTTKTDNSKSLNAWGAYSATAQSPDDTSTWFTTDDATFEITGVQLEVGPVATPFEFRSFGEQFALCQRYFQKLELHGAHVVMGNDANRTSRIPQRLSTRMRAIPTSQNLVKDTAAVRTNQNGSSGGSNLSLPGAVSPRTDDLIEVNVLCGSGNNLQTVHYSGATVELTAEI